MSKTGRRAIPPEISIVNIKQKGGVVKPESGLVERID
jgi:hypothetical protein